MAQLLRSKNKVFGGVCGGIANYFGWDPAMTRLGYLLLTFLTAFAGGIVYIILWIVMPEEGSTA